MKLMSGSALRPVGQKPFIPTKEKNMPSPHKVQVPVQPSVSHINSIEPIQTEVSMPEPYFKQMFYPIYSKIEYKTPDSAVEQPHTGYNPTTVKTSSKQNQKKAEHSNTLTTHEPVDLKTTDKTKNKSLEESRTGYRPAEVKKITKRKQKKEELNYLAEYISMGIIAGVPLLVMALNMAKESYLEA